MNRFKNQIERLSHSITLRVMLTLGLLIFGLYDLPISWATGRVMRHAMKSAEMGRESTGYYEGLIGSSDPSAGALERALVGQPSDWVHFADSGVSQLITDDILQFMLLPNVSRSLFGNEFTTNEFRMRDRPTTIAKPPNTVRIALLGASMDMGWGVSTDNTYENRLEDWLNAKAQERGENRRFEILNLAVAAYSPSQRLEVYRRIARKFQPDLVFYATTMLDPRLTEIHLGDCIQNKVDLSGSPILASVVSESKYDSDNIRRDARGRWLDKEEFKNWVGPRRDQINQEILSTLAHETRTDGVEMVCLIIPRAGRNDLAHLRAEGVALQVESAKVAGVPVWDLTDSFDGEDPTSLSVAEWDDHPNTRGHELIYQDLIKHLLKDDLKTRFGLSSKDIHR